MSEIGEIELLLKHAKTLMIHLGAIVIDAAFLSIWAFTQHVVDAYVVSKLQLSGIDSWILLAFQWIFSISTIIPVLAAIYVDTRIIFLRAKQQLSNVLVNAEGANIND